MEMFGLLHHTFNDIWLQIWKLSSPGLSFYEKEATMALYELTVFLKEEPKTVLPSA